MKTNTTETKACSSDVIMSQFFQDCKDIQYYIAAYKKKPSSNKKRLIKGMVLQAAQCLVDMNAVDTKIIRHVLLQHYMIMFISKLDLNNL